MASDAAGYARRFGANVAYDVRDQAIGRDGRPLTMDDGPPEAPAQEPEWDFWDTPEWRAVERFAQIELEEVRNQLEFALNPLDPNHQALIIHQQGIAAVLRRLLTPEFRLAVEEIGADETTEG